MRPEAVAVTMGILRRRRRMGHYLIPRKSFEQCGGGIASENTSIASCCYFWQGRKAD